MALGKFRRRDKWGRANAGPSTALRFGRDEDSVWFDVER
jgi:hypothetical protein